MSKKRPEDQTMCLGFPAAPPSVNGRMRVTTKGDLPCHIEWLEPGDEGYEEAGDPNRSLIPEDDVHALEPGDKGYDEASDESRTIIPVLKKP